MSEYNIDIGLTGFNVTWLLPGGVTAPQEDATTGYLDASQYQLNPIGSVYRQSTDELIEVPYSGTLTGDDYAWQGNSGSLLVTQGEINIAGLYAEDKAFNIENIIMQTNNMMPNVGSLGIINMGSKLGINRVVLISTDPLLPSSRGEEMKNLLNTGVSGLLGYVGIGFGNGRLGPRFENGGTTGEQYRVNVVPEMDNIILGRHDYWVLDKQARIPEDEIGSYDLRYPDPLTLVEAGFHDQVYRDFLLKSSTTWGECRQVFGKKLYVTQVFNLGVLDRREMVAATPYPPSDNGVAANALFAYGGGALEMPPIHVNIEGSVEKLDSDEVMRLTSKQIVDWNLQHGYSA